METVVGPVLVVAILDIGFRAGQAEFRVEEFACDLQAQGTEEAFLDIGAGLVGSRSSVVIEGEGVVPIVQVDETKIHIKARTV